MIDVSIIKEAMNHFQLKDIAKYYKINPSTVSKIKRGIIWQ